MVREPSILLLDEATSALDAATEDAVNQTIARLAGRCTIIAVTHRPERICGADRFFVLDAGTLEQRTNR
jgi:ABC-type bacteriocin/lantibiotic exporter with double-glycine peptidase domain